MKKTFQLHTEPHVAEIGDVELLFVPEVMGDEFLDNYERLREAQTSIGVDVSDLNKVEPAKLRQVVGSLRLFLARLMVEESAERFARWDVVVAGKTVSTHGDPDLAAVAAAKRKNATVVDKSMRLPDRVLVELLEWAVELYGGGGSRPTLSSSGSAQASPNPGTPGKAVSRSRASLPARGR
ncbi:hypothetical protein ACFPN0_15320 [Kitasatospora cinereorecta]